MIGTLSFVGDKTFSSILFDDARIFSLTSFTDVGDLSLTGSASRNPKPEFCREITGVVPPLSSLSPPLPADPDLQ